MTYDSHSFSVELAIKLGLREALMLKHIAYWVKYNSANGKNFYDGKYWTYNSKASFAKIFPYMTERRIRTTLENLINNGFVVTGVFNQNIWDKTLWYSLTEKGMSFFEDFDQSKTPITLDKNANHARDKEFLNNTLPDINTDRCIYPREENKNSFPLNHPNGVKEVIEEAEKHAVKITEEQAQDFINHNAAVAQGETWIQRNTPVRDWRKLITSGWINNWKHGGHKRKSQPTEQVKDYTGV